ncbi:MAG: hypothetical protein JJV98_03400 [Desulfosarcina sp.]|nr:hypothetical protein [Desulfobacterales bacterium]
MFTDPVLIGGLVAGLAMGSFGYVLFRFGLHPAWRYRRLKSRITAIVGPDGRDDLNADDSDRLRRLAAELHTLVSPDLPQWFQLALKRRAEAPEEAVRHLQSLVNCREAAAIRKRREAVCQSLRISGLNNFRGCQ